MKKKIEKLSTPFGEIKIFVDGKPISYIAQKGRNMDTLCPHILGRYQIVVNFIPDGENHTISCIFDSKCLYEKISESGERLECQSFYNNHGFKMSIGVECEAGYIDGKKAFDEYDYDVEYLENGMSFLIDMNTNTECYVFGISWIDNVEFNDLIDNNDGRDVETWHGANPMIGL